MQASTAMTAGHAESWARTLVQIAAEVVGNEVVLTGHLDVAPHRDWVAHFGDPTNTFGCPLPTIEGSTLHVRVPRRQEASAHLMLRLQVLLANACSPIVPPTPPAAP